MTPETRERIKRGLGPLLPVLRPIKRGISTVIFVPISSVGSSADRGRYAIRGALRAARGRTEPPIRALRKYEFDALARRAPYYRPRWGYISAAGRIADGLIERYGLRSALELGPYLRPVIVGADAMDRQRQADLDAEGEVFIHDATKTPWPFDDKQYDLFVALQVFEHLAGQQASVFREVRRIAKHAEISLPIDWVMDDPTNIHHQLSHETALSWFAPVLPTRVEIGNPGRRKRLIYVFENLPA